MNIAVAEPLPLRIESFVAAAPTVSIVIPAHDEQNSLPSLLDELLEVLPRLPACEILCVDDGSHDATRERLILFRKLRYPALRILGHDVPQGQSMALLHGIRAARGDLIVTLDADGQNVPADMVSMLAQASARPAGSHFCIAGHRIDRRDTRSKRWQSRIANAVRSRLLGDGTPDTGCALKVMPRDTWLALPAFDHMHRFLPALVRRLGGDIIVQPVSHRPRLADASKYGLLDRLGAGIVDMIGVIWLGRRTPAGGVIELPPE